MKGEEGVEVVRHGLWFDDRVGIFEKRTICLVSPRLLFACDFHSAKFTPFYTFTAVSVTDSKLSSEEEDTMGRPAASCVASHSGTSALGIFRSR